MPNTVRRRAFFFLASVWLFFSLTSTPWSAPLINPQEAIKDPMVVRLQQGRKTLTPVEEEEIKKYGFTGLEIMTYLDYNKENGKNNDSIQTIHVINSSGSVLSYGWMMKTTYEYKELADLYLHKTIKPGDVWRKKLIIFFDPPDFHKNGILNKSLLRSKDQPQEEESWQYFSNLRRARRMTYNYEDEWVGSCFSRDDREYRKAWEDEHRILGEDTINGQACLVIESKHLRKGYYLSKRVTWVTKDSFVDLHEEQFDKKGRLFRVVDDQWEQVKPLDYWARTRRYCIGLDKQVKAIHQLYGWKFDQDIPSSLFTLGEMQKENFWRPIDPPPLPVKNGSGLPISPSIRWPFWDKIGVKPLVVK